MDFINKIANCLSAKKQQSPFNALLEANYQKLYRLSYAWTQSAVFAQDLVQETMLKSIEKQHQLQSLQQIEPWLCKIMHNLYMDKLRYQKKWQFVDMEDIDLHKNSRSCEDFCINEQAELNIHQAIGCLPVEQRQVITLISVKGFSYQEVAEIMDVPVGTVMSRLSRAREKLKQRLSLDHAEKELNIDKVVFLRRKR
jgi:RNA polymerase sigma-70 factor (ECF subfamily)